MMENSCQIMFEALSCVIKDHEGNKFLEAPMSDGWYCMKLEKPKERSHKEKKKET